MDKPWKCKIASNHFAGKWNLETTKVDAPCLPQEIYEKGVIELLSNTKPSDKKDIVSYLIETTGPTFTNAIITPVVKKLYDVDPATLTTGSSVSYFGLDRILALSPAVTNKLKELAVFDDKLCFHTRNEFEKSVQGNGEKISNHYYPKKSVGVQIWVQRLLQLAEDNNVSILNDEYVADIEHDSGQIKSIKLSNSKKIECDFMLWTASPALALEAASVPMPKSSAEYRTANVFHFSYDKPLLNDEPAYLWYWDGEYKGFRITLYPNM